MATPPSQVLAAKGILAALQLSLVAAASSAADTAGGSGAQDFRAGFNSLGAFASVNHLHWHTGFMREVFGGASTTPAAFPCELSPRTTVLEAPGLLRLSRTTAWPLPLLVFEALPVIPRPRGRSARQGATAAAAAALGAAQAVLARVAGTVVSALQAANTPHSVLITDGGLTLLLAPRRGQSFLQGLQQQGALTAGLNLAVAEVCGLAVALTQEAYDGLTDAAYTAMLRAAALPEPEFEGIVGVAEKAVAGEAAAARGVQLQNSPVPAMPGLT